MDITTAPIKLRLAKGGLDGIKVGTAIYGDKREILGHLCSREANVYLETLKDAEKEQGNVLDMLGVRYLTATEKDGYKRTYYSFGTVHAVEGSEFDANVTDLNKFCDVFSHGYAVSSEDFDNEAEFREIVRKLSPEVPVRVPARRNPRSRDKPSEECKPQADPKAYGRLFFHADEVNRSVEVPSEFWTKGYPKNMCADKPRTTVVMGIDGYLDVPAITRLPVICASGL
ncbi:hypothetical protein COOONC_09160 [Cooperia oncophora]